MASGADSQVKRRSTLSVLAVTAFVIAVVVYYYTESSRVRPLAPIAVTAVDFPGMQLRPGADKNIRTLVGRIRNKSEHETVMSVKLLVTMEDVLASGASTTVAEAVVMLRQEVPPRESREFSESVALNTPSKAAGRHEWNYRVMEVMAK